MRFISIFVLALALTVSGGARADRDTEAPWLNAADLGVLQHLHDVHLMEIDAANLAVKQGSPRVRMFARALRRDHQVADAMLGRLVDAHDQAVVDHPKPATEGDRLDAERHAVGMAKLAELEGEEFDDVYLEMTHRRHDKLVAYIVRAIEQVDDDGVRALLERAQRTENEHRGGP